MKKIHKTNKVVIALIIILTIIALLIKVLIKEIDVLAICCLMGFSIIAVTLISVLVTMIKANKNRIKYIDYHIYIYIIMLAVVSLIFIPAVTHNITRKNDLLNDGVKTTAIVYNVGIDYDSLGTFGDFDSKLYVKYTIEGQEYTSDLIHDTDKYKIGDEITIYCNKDNFSDIISLESDKYIVWLLVTAIIMDIIFIYGIIKEIVIRKRKKKNIEKDS